MNDAYPKVSVVLPVLNRARSIERCLQSLVKMDYPSYEVIVVDNGSTDDTPAIVSKFPVTLMHEPVRGPYRARNTGARAADGTLVFFIDSDCVADEKLLKTLVKALQENDVAAVGGPLKSHDPEGLVEQFGDLAGILQYTYPRGLMKRNKKKFLTGAIFTSNAMFRKSVLEELGYFDAAMKSGGDFDFCWRLQRAGYRIYFEPDAVVYHIHRSGLKGLVKQFFKYGSEQPHLLKKQPGNISYIKLKTYLFPQVEFSARFPLQVLINIDCCNLLPFLVLAAMFSGVFIYPALFLLACVGAGTLYQASIAARQSGQRKWYFLFPVFHFIRNYAFTAGRIRGGIGHRMLCF